MCSLFPAWPRSSGVGFFCFHALGNRKSKETYPTKPGSPTPCKQGLRIVFFTSTFSSLPNRPGRRAIARDSKHGMYMVSDIYNQTRVVLCFDANGEHCRKIKSIWNFKDPVQNPNSIIMQLQLIFLSSLRPIGQLWIFCQIIQDPRWCFSILRQASFSCSYNSAACSWAVTSSWSSFSLSSVKMSYG